MNSIREHRRAAGIDVADLADETGYDIAAVAMAEAGMGVVSVDFAVTVARFFDVSPGDLFPGTAEVFEEALAIESGDDMADALLEPERAAVLADAGIDPDIIPWYAIVRFAGGGERRYRLPSVDLARIKADLASGPGEFVYMLADCRHVAVRKSAIAEVTFTHLARYQDFASKDSAFEVTIQTRDSVRPERVEVEPDGGEDGKGERPFSEFLEGVISGSGIPTFLLVSDERGDERMIATSRIEAVEISVGVTHPQLYLDAEGVASTEEAAELLAMPALGTA